MWIGIVENYPVEKNPVENFPVEKNPVENCPVEKNPGENFPVWKKNSVLLSSANFNQSQCIEL